MRKVKSMIANTTVENNIKNAYISAFEINDKSLKDLIIINTKCLIDDKIQRYVYIDNNRLRDELIYYKFYGEKLSTKNIINILLPVILSNTNTDKSEEVVIDLVSKYIKFLKIEENTYEYILSAICYNIIIHKLIENKNVEYEELLQSAKEKIIGFTMELDKSQVVKFQMERIKAIQIIDKYIDLKVYEYEEDKVLINILNVLYDIYIEDRETSDNGILGIKKSILSILNFEENLNINNIDFILSMSEYVIKLRKYIINKKIYNNRVDPRTLIKLEVGDTTIDPIFNQIEIIKKDFKNDILEIGLKAKSGIYNLKFKKS